MRTVVVWYMEKTFDGAFKCCKTVILEQILAAILQVCPWDA